MSKEMYFLLSGHEDGVSVEMLEYDELVKKFTPDEYGYSDFNIDDLITDAETLDKTCLYSTGKAAVIKGRVVSPKPIKVVKSVRFE